MTTPARTLSPGWIATELPPISLDELNGLAALQTRIDRKYVVTSDCAERALRTIADRLAALDIGGDRTFRYDSLYFDTPELLAYRAAATRRRRRFKVRIRRYVDSGLTALEVKTRGRRGQTSKARLAYEPECVEILEPDALAYIDQVLDNDDIASRLQPVMWTRYRRSTLIDLEDRSRITLDSHLAAASAAMSENWRHLTDALVIETKSARGSTPLDRALWAQHVRPVSISKYAISMAVHHPELPANRWSRLISNHVESEQALSTEQR